MTEAAFDFKNARGVAADPTRALDYATRAAEGGSRNAMYILAVAHQTGDGAPQDWRVARHWYERLAERGDEDAMFRLGLIAANGEVDPPDPEIARDWLKRALDAGCADAGDVLAQIEAGIANGGSPVDPGAPAAKGSGTGVIGRLFGKR